MALRLRGQVGRASPQGVSIEHLASHRIYEDVKERAVGGVVVGQTHFPQVIQVYWTLRITSAKPIYPGHRLDERVGWVRIFSWEHFQHLVVMATNQAGIQLRGKMLVSGIDASSPELI